MIETVNQCQALRREHQAQQQDDQDQENKQDYPTAVYDDLQRYQRKADGSISPAL